MVIDDNSLYRQEDYTLLPRTSQKKSPQELDAAEYDLTYVELDSEGDIGMIAGGAGIGMATMDTIHHYEGIARAYKEFGNNKRVVVKSRGFNQEQGWAIYEALGFLQTKYGTTDEAVQALLSMKGA